MNDPGPGGVRDAAPTHGCSDILARKQRALCRYCCNVCGTSYDVDNSYFCLDCGTAYCVRCIHDLEIIGSEGAVPKRRWCGCDGVVV